MLILKASQRLDASRRKTRLTAEGKLKDGIIRRGRKWAYVIRVTDAHGVSKPKWVSGFDTEAEAKAACDQARSDARRGNFVHRNDLTVERYVRTWLEGHALEIKAKTLEDYRSLLDRYVLPRIGRMRLQSVRTCHAEHAVRGTPAGRRARWPAVVAADGGVRPLDNSEGVQRCRPHRAGAGRQSKALRAKRPKVEAVQAIRPMWDARRLARFVEAVAEDRLYPFYRLAAYTGERRGELFYLRWSSVVLDPNDSHVWIKGSTAIVRGPRVDGTTKTGRARRVSIDPGTVQALRNHAERQPEDRELIGDGWPDSDLVFRMGMGGPLRTDLPGEVMRATIPELDSRKEPLPMIRLHDLRHIHATLLLKAGIPAHVVAARLGHADAALTLRVYAHVLSDQATSAAATFASLLGEEGGE